MPYWKAILQSDKYKGESLIRMPAGANAEFRDMILRQVLHLPENKNGTIFARNNDGTYGINMAKRNEIVRQYGGKDYDGTIFIQGGTKKEIGPHEYRFVGSDNIAGVGGQTGDHYVYDPNTGKGTATLTDLWDIQPFSDWRSPLPWLNPIAKNFEAMSFLGGKPTTQVIRVDNPVFKEIPSFDTSKVKVSQFKK